MRIRIFHNIMWSKYKGEIFSRLHEKSISTEVDISFIQIAETESARVGLSNIDFSYHRYPHKLLFKGSYDVIPLWKRVFSLAREVFITNADLVILPGYHRLEYWVMLLACLISKRKRAVFCDSTANDRPSSRIRSMAKILFFRLCDGYFGYGVRSREYLISLGANQERVFYRCQSAALPHDYTEATAHSARIKNAADPDQPRFLFVGRLSLEKGLDDLINAFSLVLKELPNARLVLVGSGLLRAQLEKQCRDCGIAEAVEFPGSMGIDALAVEYSKATCMVLPSRTEPWGLVVNEALAYGCPVVVSNVCGCAPELVRTGETGFEFEVGNVSELAQRMLTLAKTFLDPEAVAKRCISHISPFSPEAAAQRILEGCITIIRGSTR